MNESDQHTLLFEVVRASASKAGQVVIPTRVYMIAEVVDEDGNEAMWASNTDVAPWTAIGLLEAELVRLRMILEHDHAQNTPGYFGEDHE